jgi:hypothetical protein
MKTPSLGDGQPQWVLEHVFALSCEPGTRPGRFCVWARCARRAGVGHNRALTRARATVDSKES